jgi:hypothetical protein
MEEGVALQVVVDEGLPGSSALLVMMPTLLAIWIQWRRASPHRL